MDEAKDVQGLVRDFEHDDIRVRHRAGMQLIAMGNAAIDVLVGGLSSENHRVRREAAHTLSRMDARGAMPALISAMEDTYRDVQWVAAEALRAQGRAGVIALLHAFSIGGADVRTLQDSAHHVIRNQLGASFGHHLVPVLHALEGLDRELTVPIAAYRALEQLQMT